MTVKRVIACDLLFCQLYTMYNTNSVSNIKEVFQLQLEKNNIDILYNMKICNCFCNCEINVKLLTTCALNEFLLEVFIITKSAY